MFETATECSYNIMLKLISLLCLNILEYIVGMDISEIDLLNIKLFSSKVVSLGEFRKSVSDYLRDKMGIVAPNLCTLIGEQVGG